MTAPLDMLPMVTRADHVPGPAQGCWTYADYAAIPEDGRRYEVIDGVLFMSPAPRVAHQRAVGRIFRQLSLYAEGSGTGEAFVAPVDVQLAPGTVVQPDVSLVLHEHASIVADSGIIGPPDLVVEVSSPGTVGHDRRQKQDAYARAGVPEYWIVDAVAQTVELLLLEGAEYRSAGLFLERSLLPSRVLPALPLQVAQFFA